MAETKKYILTKDVAEKKLRRMAFEILENNTDEKEIILAGIRESGSVVARVVQKMLGEISSIKTELITVTLDKKKPDEASLSKTFNFNNKVIIVIDDVSNSGKTLLYALKPFIEYHPKKIQILVLVERTHTSFPVRPDYVGLSLATTIQEHIFVEVKGEEITGAYLE
ncbi:MAG TPA: phosphoribosyltransferase family protein [Chitinophagaceae bacterium]|nr:phosphoribosyltransferase family protein [Chitinophagaceae bacterium]